MEISPIFFAPFTKKAIEGQPHRFAVIIDETVYRLRLFPTLNSLDPSPILLPSGEQHKTRATKERIEDILLKKGYNKEAAIIAIGGGVTLDLAGFIASTYCRGVPFISVPTTLLAMIDACLGGKTAVNVDQGKNMIGTFYPASSIWIDTSLLRTLPDREFHQGLAEIIKYGLVASSEIFSLLSNQTLWTEKNTDFLYELIRKSLAAKQSILEQDPKEKGLRRILNFGHTVGHAIEQASRYTYSHGESIGVGMFLESILSYLEGFLAEKSLQTICKLLLDYGFYKPLDSLPSLEQLLQAMAYDKKNLNRSPRFVLLSQIGKAADCKGAYCKEISSENIQRAFHYYANICR